MLFIIIVLAIFQRFAMYYYYCCCYYHEATLCCPALAYVFVSARKELKEVIRFTLNSHLTSYNRPLAKMNLESKMDTVHVPVATIGPMESLSAVRNLIRCAVHYIALARDLRHEREFCESTAFGSNVPVLDRTKSVIAEKIVSSLEDGAFHALNNGYLEELSLCLYNSALTNVEESFIFSFKYNESTNLVSVSLATEAPARSDSVACVEKNVSQRGMFFTDLKLNNNPVVQNETPCELADPTLSMMATLLSKLGNIVKAVPRLRKKHKMYMSFRLRFNERTPDDYQPPGFSAPTTEMTHMFFREQRYKVSPTVISASTTHHSVGFSLANAALVRARRHHETTVLDCAVGTDGTVESIHSCLSGTSSTSERHSTTDFMTLPSNPSTFSMDAAKAVPYRAGNITRDESSKKKKSASFGVSHSHSHSQSHQKLHPQQKKETKKGEKSCSAGSVASDASATSLQSSRTDSVDEAPMNREPETFANSVLPHESTQQLSVEGLQTIRELANRQDRYRSREVAYLFFCVYLFRLYVSVSGGRRITTADVQHFLQYDSPWDVTPEWATDALQRLVKEGYLEQKSAAVFEESSPAAASTTQWLFSVADFKPLCKKIIRHEEVRVLFSVPPSGHKATNPTLLGGSQESTREAHVLRRKRNRSTA